ncbi:hypothetical protein MWN63_14295 [Paradonghicola geojensis]|nr:hypothetical protein [Marivivens geojensis]
MLRVILAVSVLMVLASCGTTRGVLDGTGSVLEGMAADVRSLGGMLN